MVDMMRTIRWMAVLLAGMVLSSPGPLAAASDAPLEVEALLGEALERNPRIAAARGRHGAMQERVPQAGALEDPMLGLGVVSLPTSFDFNAEDMTMKELSVSQRLPFPGKLSLRQEAARHEAESASAETDEIANQVVRDVKAAYYDLSHVYRSIEVTRRNQAILEDFAKLARTRYAVGQGIQEDVLRAQVEISKMVDELIMFDQKRRSLAARINFLVGRPPGSPLGEPADFDFRRLALTIEDLQQSALEENPSLRGLRKAIAARRSSLELARRDYFPDFGVRLAYGQRDDRLDMLSGMVELNIPLFVKSKQERKVAEALAELKMEEAGYENLKNETLYMIADLGSMARRLEQQIDLYRTGIIPQADLQITTAISAYMVDKADFMTLLDSRMRLYRYELTYHQALTDYEKNLALLEAAVGKRFDREGGK
jgi:outer membrane protein TolC